MFNWRKYASCKGLDTNFFFDEYEADAILAQQIDKLCHSCPVRGLCFAAGVENKEVGVWGGVYLKDGKPDKKRNMHKNGDL